MTTIDYYLVERRKGYNINHHIAGDLSHSYVAVPTKQPDGVGMASNSLKDARKSVDLAKKIGYSKAFDKWSDKARNQNYRFGYLPKDEARKYANDDRAYGDYAEKFKKEESKEHTIVKVEGKSNIKQTSAWKNKPKEFPNEGKAFRYGIGTWGSGSYNVPGGWKPVRVSEYQAKGKRPTRQHRRRKPRRRS